MKVIGVKITGIGENGEAFEIVVDGLADMDVNVYEAFEPFITIPKFDMPALGVKIDVKPGNLRSGMTIRRIEQ